MSEQEINASKSHAHVVPVTKTLMLHESQELILFFDPIPETFVIHQFSRLDKDKYLSQSFRLTLYAFPTKTLGPNNNLLADKPMGEPYYSVPLSSLNETTVIITQLANGTDWEDAYILDKASSGIILKFQELEITDIGWRGEKGESCFGRPDDRKYFSVYGFTLEQAFKMVSAMHLVSESLCSKLGKFEAAFPDGAGGRIWNIRKSQNREPLKIYSSDADCGCCGNAEVLTGQNTHPIHFTLHPSMIDRASPLGIACVMIHEISHQFGVEHTGWLNTNDFMGALWASHSVSNVRRSDIESYYNSAVSESGCL